jgi:hypothetical protein
MFDLDAAFAEFSAPFKGTGNLQLARALWDTQVNGPEAASCHAAIMAGLRPGHLKATPEWALREIFGAKLPNTDAPQVVTSHATRPSEAPRAPSESYTAFREIWTSWPHDPIRRREQESHAKFEWDRAVADHGGAAVRAACLDIARDEARLTHRRNLSTVLAALISGEESIEARPPITADVVAAFEAADRRYPNPADDKQEALDLYLAYVPADQRLDFRAACLIYARLRRPKEFTMSWAKFCSGGWREVDARNVKLLRDLARNLGSETDMMERALGHGGGYAYYSGLLADGCSLPDFDQPVVFAEIPLMEI